jgi:hypothetical protein
MVDLKRVGRPTSQNRDDVTPYQIRAAMAKRLEVIAVIFDTTASQLLHEQSNDDMMNQLGAAAELLSSEIDVLNEILIER